MIGMAIVNAIQRRLKHFENFVFTDIGIFIFAISAQNSPISSKSERIILHTINSINRAIKNEIIHFIQIIIIESIKRKTPISYSFLNDPITTPVIFTSPAEPSSVRIGRKLGSVDRGIRKSPAFVLLYSLTVASIVPSRGFSL